MYGQHQNNGTEHPKIYYVVITLEYKRKTILLSMKV